MWSPSSLIVWAALLLGACGFQPLYGARDGGAGGSTGGRLAVEVSRIAEREGQVLRDALAREFDAGAIPVYRLDVTLSEEISTLAIDSQGDAIRRRMTLTARWRLTPLDAASGRAAFSGNARDFEGFNVLASDFANLTAERAARERAALRLARRIAYDATARTRIKPPA